MIVPPWHYLHFTVSYRFCHISFSFLFNTRNVLIFFCNTITVQCCFFLVSMSLCIFFMVSLLISSFITLQWKKNTGCYFIMSLFSEMCCEYNMWSILVKGLWTAKKNVYSFIFEWNVLGISVIPIWFVVTLDFSVFLLSFVQLINLLTIVLYWSRETSVGPDTSLGPPRD